ncbi:MAG TPA: adenylate/guanylate cyclase domain-containing protein [Stellaceae bacterium]|nr:adenylate/guanylate cyclase domain-containing protein [Stellaceae bacterium]
MAPARIERKLAAILAADVAGYSRLAGADEERTLARLRALRGDLIDPAIAAHHGRVVKRTGDGILIEFRSVVDAVRAAIEVQSGMVERNAGLPPERRIEFRIGIHIGDVIEEADGDLMGDGVNIAARLEGIAEPGGISLSEDAYRQVRDKISATIIDLGDRQLKNIARPVRAYKVELSASPDAPKNAPPPLPDKPSIAVLPFQNMSGDPEQEYFADGMVEDIITALSRFRQLFVIARNSTFSYKARAMDVKQVGREFGVRYVLEGSVRKAGNRVRITGQLIDTETGTHLWADRFEGALEDVFDLQDQVTARVVGAIAPKLEQAEIERAKRKPTESLDAYDYYLRGLASLYRWTKEGVAEALRMSYKAIEIDPDFASAYGVAAWCYFLRTLSGWMLDRRQEVAETTRLAAKAIELGNDDAVVLSFSGGALGYVGGDLETGIALIDQALVLNPNLATAWSASAMLRAFNGDLDVAIDHSARAVRLSPLDPLAFLTYSVAGLAHLLAGHYDEAWPVAEKACRERPNFLSAIRVAAASNAMAGRPDEAGRFIARALQLDPELRISNLKDRIPAWRRQQDFANYAAALRKAGLPE